MRTVWKFQLENHRSLLPMPRGAEILHIDCQGSDVFLWALVDTSQPPVDRMFEIVPTGGNAGGYERQHYIGTASTPIGYVWHVFEAFAP